eukprot:1705817-Rhodomonas_salina.2
MEAPTLLGARHERAQFSSLQVAREGKWAKEAAASVTRFCFGVVLVAALQGVLLHRQSQRSALRRSEAGRQAADEQKRRERVGGRGVATDQKRQYPAHASACSSPVSPSSLRLVTTLAGAVLRPGKEI